MSINKRQVSLISLPEFNLPTNTYYGNKYISGTRNKILSHSPPLRNGYSDMKQKQAIIDIANTGYQNYSSSQFPIYKNDLTVHDEKKLNDERNSLLFDTIETTNSQKWFTTNNSLIPQQTPTQKSMDFNNYNELNNINHLLNHTPIYKPLQFFAEESLKDNLNKNNSFYSMKPHLNIPRSLSALPYEQKSFKNITNSHVDNSSNSSNDDHFTDEQCDTQNSMKNQRLCHHPSYNNNIQENSYNISKRPLCNKHATESFSVSYPTPQQSLMLNNSPSYKYSNLEDKRTPRKQYQEVALSSHIVGEEYVPFSLKAARSPLEKYSHINKNTQLLASLSPVASRSLLTCSKEFQVQFPNIYNGLTKGIVDVNILISNEIVIPVKEEINLRRTAIRSRRAITANISEQLWKPLQGKFPDPAIAPKLIKKMSDYFYEKIELGIQQAEDERSLLQWMLRLDVQHSVDIRLTSSFGVGCNSTISNIEGAVYIKRKKGDFLSLIASDMITIDMDIVVKALFLNGGHLTEINNDPQFINYVHVTENRLAAALIHY